MNKIFNKVGLMIALNVVATTSLAAQSAEQTPANAHLFMKQLASQGRISLEPPDYKYRNKHYTTTGYNNRYSITSWESDGTFPPMVLSIADSSACQTMVNPYKLNSEAYSQAASYYDGNTKLTIPGKETWHYYVPHVQYLNSAGINWALVSKVTNDGTGVVWLYGNGFSGGYIKLIFDSTDMAARGAYAMEVIRQSCDPVAKTGF